MALQIRENAAQNNMLDSIDTTVGASGHFKIFSGSQPANCSAANPSGELANFHLPNPAWQAASAGQMVKSASSWQEDSAIGTGTAASFRIYSSQATMDGTTCQLQGSCGIGTGDLQFDNTSIASGQVVTVSTFTLIAGNDS